MSVTEKCLEAPLQAEAVARACGGDSWPEAAGLTQGRGSRPEGLVLTLAELGVLAGALVPKRSLYHEVVGEGSAVSLGDVSEVSTFQTSERSRPAPSSLALSGVHTSSSTARPRDQTELQQEQNSTLSSLPGAPYPERWESPAPWRFQEGGAGPRGRGACFRVLWQ